MAWEGTLWDVPEVVTPVKVTEKKEEFKAPDKELVAECVVQESKSEPKKRCKYVVLAYKTLAGRQYYLSSWEDEPDDVVVSAVPFPTTKTRCWEMIAQYKKLEQERAAKSKMKRRERKLDYTIVEYK